jgi:cysteine desulfurase
MGGGPDVLSDAPRVALAALVVAANGLHQCIAGPDRGCGSPRRRPGPSAGTYDDRMEQLYLDSNSTTRPADEVVRAMVEALAQDWGNPSSMHRVGQAARQRVDLARESVARLIGASGRELIFTSGGTEAANLAILGSLRAQPGRDVVITSRIEHGAVREVAEQLETTAARSPVGRTARIVWLEAGRDGRVDLEQLRRALQDEGERTALVSVMWVNNETGVIQPLELIGGLCREHGVRLHTDATQAIGKIPCDVSELPVDLLSFSAHKFHGPKGTGALFVRRGVRLAQQQIGGPQEKHLRGGTENVAGVVGMGIASDLAARWLDSDGPARAAALRDAFERRLLESVEDTVVNGATSPRTWSTSNVAFRGVSAEPLLLLLSERGVCASAGAACSSGSLEPSPVLSAMGLDQQLAAGSVRFSFSRETTEQEIARALPIITEAVGRLRAVETA